MRARAGRGGVRAPGCKKSGLGFRLKTPILRDFVGRVSRGRVRRVRVFTFSFFISLVFLLATRSYSFSASSCTSMHLFIFRKLP